MAVSAANASSPDRARTPPGGPRPTRSILSPDELARLRRRWWIPVAATVLVAAVMYAVLALGASQYAAQATLEVFSKEKTPSEDTVLASGYADLFNEPDSQTGVRQQAGVDPSAVLTARLAGSGPILYITATASDRQVAQDAANGASTAFRNQINQSLGAVQYSPVARAKDAGPTTLDILQVATGATTVTESKARAVLPWAALTFLVSLAAVVYLPGRRRRDAAPD